ncbi:MAG TPA: S8 family serine peptidase [Bryobacteraceae bacterium]|jgi:uncharacterized protein (TIGR03437 family)|nr:S8 family serine peptidase [Bryobacteraceae bacterium]
MARPGGGREALASSEAAAPRRVLLSRQDALRSTLATRKIGVTGAIHTLLNAVFVAATEAQADELRALPGVKSVVRMPEVRRTMNKALDLVNARAAWTTLGGQDQAGAGVKIAIVDTGIDETHPAFRDSTLSMPPGFPKGSGDDLNHATNKIIAVRSYVLPLALFDGQPVNTRPDDLSARDHFGHGTGLAMAAAGAPVGTPLGTISGVAPKAWLGNYKIFGSPGVNDVTFADVMMQAVDAAFNDGMDVALLPLTIPIVFNVREQCDGGPCDPWAAEVESATTGGMAIVVPAGNTGDGGPNNITTPGTAPSGITVGASTNSHLVTIGVRTGGNVLSALSGDGPQPLGPITLPAADTATLGGSLACSPLNARIDGKIALIDIGTCGFAVKVNNAANAGAAAAILIREAGANTLFTPGGLGVTGIPTVLIGADSGAALRSFVSAQPAATITIDLAVVETAAGAESRAPFSSVGPSITDLQLKPELVAPGSSIYTAAQNLDPNGDFYSATRFGAMSGTSVAAAIATGAAALVKQANPRFTPAQLKSALANTASAGFPGRITEVGAGKLNAQAAVTTTVTADPALVSFGRISSTTLNVTRSVRITNTAAASANLQLAVSQNDADARGRVTVSPTSVTLTPGQSTNATLTFSGTLPLAGVYEGVINVTGGAVPLRIPYAYFVSDGIPAALVHVLGDDFVANAGDILELDFKVVDRFGIALPDIPVQFTPATSVKEADRVTEASGIAFARVFAGPQLGTQTFTATVGTMQIRFQGRTRTLPSIRANGVVNAASVQAGAGIAPGSYITIFGAGMAEGPAIYRTPYLPLSLAGTSVSFDDPSRGVSAPGRLSYSSEGQVNVQVPWELQGSSSVTIKVALGGSITSTVTLPVVAAAPAAFEYTDPSSGQLLAAALDEGFKLVSPSNPVQRGHIIQLYVNGLGATDNQPASGETSPAQPLANTRVVPVVTIGGKTASVQFSGLAPFFVGLYQVNVVVPADLTPGLQTVVISSGGVPSKNTAIPVQ